MTKCKVDPILWATIPRTSCPYNACCFFNQPQVYMMNLYKKILLCFLLIYGEAAMAIPNPSAVYCIEHGGRYQIETRSAGGQDGICFFEDNRACEAWALFRGVCPKGGMKFTGYTTPEQIYCALQGGHTSTNAGTPCTFADGSVCSLEALYQGECTYARE